MDSRDWANVVKAFVFTVAGLVIALTVVASASGIYKLEQTIVHHGSQAKQVCRPAKVIKYWDGTRDTLVICAKPEAAAQ